MSLSTCNPSHNFVRVQTPLPVQDGSHQIHPINPFRHILNPHITSPLTSITKITYFKVSSLASMPSSTLFSILPSLSHPWPSYPTNKKSIRVNSSQDTSHSAIVSSPSRSLSIHRPQRLKPTTVPYPLFRLLTSSFPTSPVLHKSKLQASSSLANEPGSNNKPTTPGTNFQIPFETRRTSRK